MAENSYRKRVEEEESEETVESSGEKSSTIFELAESKLGLNKILSNGLPISQLPKVLFCLFLVLIYVANTHYADKVVRKTNKMKNEVEDLRADYITLKADLMFKSKQSEMAKLVAPTGLEEPRTPPIKVEVDENEVEMNTKP